jgi:hypothetical protein
MPAPAKLLHVLGYVGKEEATYGTPIALTPATDGIQLQYKDRNVAAPLTLKYAFAGDLGPSVGNLGQVANVAPSGLSIEGDLPTRARPGGAAYSATVVPSIHRLLKSAGLDATGTFSVGTENWKYTPTAAGNGYTSLTDNLYTRGELWTRTGMLSSVKFDFSDPSPPIWTFGTKGFVSALPIDSAVPAIVYPLQTVAPPLASSVTLTLGNLSANAVVMSGSFDLQRDLQPRVAVSASGAHLGFVPHDRNPIMKVVLEATALVGTPFTSAAAFDPYNLRDKATSIAASVKFGTTQYFRYTVAFPQCQVIDAVPQNNGPVATVELTLNGYNSTATSADDVSVTFD